MVVAGADGVTLAVGTDVVAVVVVPLGVGFCLSLVAATAAALARAVVASLADLASAIVLFDATPGPPPGGVRELVLAVVVSILTLSLSSQLLSTLSLGFLMAEGGLWVIGANSSCSEMTDATEWAMAK